MQPNVHGFGSAEVLKVMFPDKRLFVIVFVTTTLLALCFPHAYKQMFRYFTGLFKDNIDVAICILSSRDHFEQRNAIRNTWLGHLMTHDILEYSVKAWFILGETSCSIPLEDRMDEYDCHPWKPHPLNESKDIAAFSVVTSGSSESLTDVVTSRLAMKVLHGVVLKRIGIFAGYAEPVTVTLWNGLTDEELVTVSFNDKDRGIEHHGYRYQAIQPLILPKGFGESWLDFQKDGT